MCFRVKHGLQVVILKTITQHATILAVADPGFPVGGVGLVEWSQGSYVSKISCVKTKKSGPLRGRAQRTDVPDISTSLGSGSSNPSIVVQKYNFRSANDNDRIGTLRRARRLRLLDPTLTLLWPEERFSTTH